MLGLGDAVAGETDQVRGAGDEMGDTPVDAGGVDLDQYLRRLDLWPVDGAQLQHLGRAVPVLDHRTHRLTLARDNDRCAAARVAVWSVGSLDGMGRLDPRLRGMAICSTSEVACAGVTRADAGLEMYVGGVRHGEAGCRRAFLRRGSRWSCRCSNRELDGGRGTSRWGGARYESRSHRRHRWGLHPRRPRARSAHCRHRRGRRLWRRAVTMTASSAPTRST